MNKYYAKLIVGIGIWERKIIEANNLDEAIEQAYDDCYDLATSYGYDTDEDHFGDNDTVGKDWCDELEDYEEQSMLECEVSVYDPCIHDSKLY